MALPVTIPNTFASATSSIPLSQLDTNFSTLANAINGINSGAETVANLKSTNVSITGGTVNNVSLANIVVSSGNATFTNVTATQANVTTANIATLQSANVRATGGSANNISFANVTISSGSINNASLGNVTLANVTVANSSITNTSVQVRVSSTASAGANLVWNSTNFDQFVINAQSQNVTINADAGSPSDGQKSIFRIKDNGSAYTISWTTGTSNSFRAIGITLPNTTVATKTVYVGCIYNSNAARWDAVATAQET